MTGQARLREALNAGGPGPKEKGPPVADGVLTVTPDTPEALEWRSRRSFMDSAGASSSYLEDDAGPRPSSLYGKFTWKIENFSEISKRELRSTVFEVGSYKWYILVYPQGCDVCNHLSLFLCVADYDKLLPGWSHFSQFTIAVVNKDPKKSKYSDTLHRFCKKEHDWGWKKFMELSKVLEGFTVSNTLVIKAQVQVIRDRPTMPFRCLDAQYRRELVRVYLTNVETICRKFVDERRAALARLRDDSAGLRAFWAALEPHQRQSLASERGKVLLKGLVKRFFNEKEVTSTLVMDALFSGCKQLEEMSRAAETRKGKKSKTSSNMVVSIDKSTFFLVGDVLGLLERSAGEATIQPHFDDKVADPLAARSAHEGEESKDFAEKDERCLGELGRRAVEMYSMAHIFSELEAAYCEAESIKRQDALIREEEEAGKREDARSAARAASEREKKARKKERRRVQKEAEQVETDRVDKARHETERLENKRLEADRAAREEASVGRQRFIDQQQQAKLRQIEAAASASAHSAAADSDAIATEADSLYSTAELDLVIDAAAPGERYTGRSPAGEEAGPSTSAAPGTADSSDLPGHTRTESDDGLSSTDPTSSTLSIEDATQQSAAQLRERVEGLQAEVDTLRSALARAQTEHTASTAELATALTDLQQAKAAVAARDVELASLRAHMATSAPAAKHNRRPDDRAGARHDAESAFSSQGSESHTANGTIDGLISSTTSSSSAAGTDGGLANGVGASGGASQQARHHGHKEAAGNGAHHTSAPASRTAQLQREGRSASGPVTGGSSGRSAAVSDAMNKPSSSAPTMPRSKSRSLNGNAAAFVPSTSGGTTADVYSNGSAPFGAGDALTSNASPQPPSKRADAVPADSPGLDDFAHMGLITDLLD
ncbi:hypothetical protein WJX73_007356 [Symbiochloris irregularis]|uniref:MATH domain-containing protein n=1 Tax=Symbiochloris irregularis TaxID=706552 RepID=A0AAW1Q3K0_9CHLO